MKKGALAAWKEKLVVVLANDNPRTAFVKIVKGERKGSKTRAPWAELVEVNRRAGKRKKTSETPSPATDPQDCPFCGAQYPSYMAGIECPNCGYHEGSKDFKVAVPAGDKTARPKGRTRHSRRRT